MWFKVKVVSDSDYSAWLKSNANSAAAAAAAAATNQQTSSIVPTKPTIGNS
jgi:heme/copper-type cytochrome/quinol oxidase subunit 2